MVERLKMELSVQKLLNSILILLNSLHEIWALLKSMGLLPLTQSEDRASSSFWQRKEDHKCVPHFRRRSMSSIWKNSRNFR